VITWVWRTTTVALVAAGMIRLMVGDSLAAWVDESIFAHPEQGFYVLAATVAAPVECESLRVVLRSLLARRADRLHWRRETPARQLLIAAEIARHNVAHTVVVGAPLDQRKQERARRYCLETLLPHLQSAGVGQVWIENRGPVENGRDRAMANAARAKHILAGPLRVDFAKPLVEPMLWIPDAVAGAFAGARRSTDSEPFKLLEHAVTQLSVTVP